MKQRICVDFDGTVFDGVGLIQGCIEKLTELRKEYTIAIFSARNGSERDRMIEYLFANGVPHDEVLPPKPEAAAFIDDKGIKFESWDKIDV